jgi:predicted glycoside hydrolase/deacetylase ChbG (UPF0249 family)
MTDRRLIVNADDLGRSAGVNRGIIDAVERGVVTSASLMVRWPAAVAAADWARDHGDLSLGLHVDLGEWAYTAGEWRTVYEVVDATDASAVAVELEWQLARFVELVGRPPVQLDSHQHVHRDAPVRDLLVDIADRLGVPLRLLGSPALYSGAFYGQSGRGEPYPEGITYEALLAVLDRLPRGVTELGCHPGADDLDDLESAYLVERGVERAVLCDPRLPDDLRRREIELVSFHDLTSSPRQ